MQATGYAIVTDGEIDVRTVSPHARGAKVNWLHVVAHVTVLRGHSDGWIEQMWREHNRDAECLPVRIFVVKEPS